MPRWKEKRKARQERLSALPLWQRVLRSLVRILVLFVAIVGGFYWWQPQKLDFQPKAVPVPNPRVDPDSKALFRKDTRVVVVAGHPDDAEFYISGTLLKLHEAGAKITLILTTDGAKSYYPPFTTNPEENRRIRRREQTTASAAYNAKVVFLGGPDGRYNPEGQVLVDLQKAIDTEKPEYVITFDPDYPPKIQHRDHRNAGVAVDAVLSNLNSRPKWVLYFATRAANYYVDTTPFWEKRSELLAVHGSQFYGEKLERIRGFVFDKAITDGEIIGTETAESYRVRRVP